MSKSKKIVFTVLLGALVVLGVYAVIQYISSIVIVIEQYNVMREVYQQNLDKYQAEIVKGITKFAIFLISNIGLLIVSLLNIKQIWKNK